jgi:hypothetical protein
VRMAVQRDRVSMVMSSVTKMDTNMNNLMKVVMLVTMAVQRDRVSTVMCSVTKMHTDMKPDAGGNACDDGHSKR